MDDKVDVLLRLLDEATELLRAYDGAHWAGWLERGAHLVRVHDLYGVEHLLKAFGGMGSLTDVLIDPANGHRVVVENVDAVNQRFGRLRNSVYILASELRHEELVQTADGQG
jgi:hypothetical protein